MIALAFLASTDRPALISSVTKTGAAAHVPIVTKRSARTIISRSLSLNPGASSISLKN